MHVSFFALCLVVVAVVGVASPASAEHMSNRYNEPVYRATTRRSPSGPWANGPYMPAPNMPGHSHPPYRPGHGPPYPGHGSRGQERVNPPPGHPGHQHTPGYKGSSRPPIVEPVNDNQIPLALFAQLNEVDDVDDFFRLMGGEQTLIAGGDSDVTNRLGIDDSVQRKGAVKYAKPAHCRPENQTVRLVPDDADPSAIYFPTCTRVPRCGGCCAGNIQSCQPTELSTLSLRVAVVRYVNNKPKQDSTLISVEQHTKCGCQCIVKEADCNLLQRYLPGECRCECTNRDDRDKCLSGTDRLWDNSTCACICRRQKNCSTGRLFSPRTCDCETLPERKRRTNPPVSDSQSEEADSQSEEAYTWPS